MDIRLSNGMRITADSHQFMLQKFSSRYVNKKTGKTEENWPTIAYCSNLSTLLQRAYKQMLFSCGATTLEELKEASQLAVRELQQIREVLDNPVDLAA